MSSAKIRCVIYSDVDNILVTQPLEPPGETRYRQYNRYLSGGVTWDQLSIPDEYTFASILAKLPREVTYV